MRELMAMVEMRIFQAHRIFLQPTGDVLPRGGTVFVQGFEEKLFEGRDVLAVRTLWRNEWVYLLAGELSVRAFEFAEEWSRAQTQFFDRDIEWKEALTTLKDSRSLIEREWKLLTNPSHLRLVEAISNDPAL